MPASQRVNTEDHVSVDLSPLEKWWQVYTKAREEAARYTEIADQARNKIVEHMEKAGADEGAIDGRTVVTYHTVKSTNFKSAAFRKDYPDLAAKYVEEREYRRFVPRTGTE